MEWSDVEQMHRDTATLIHGTSRHYMSVHELGWPQSDVSAPAREDIEGSTLPATQFVKQPAATPLDVSLRALNNAEDHLLALSTLITSKEAGRLSRHTLGRGSMEAALRAGWLLKPGLPILERVERVFGFMRDGVGADAKALKGGMTPVTSADRWLGPAEVRDDLTAHGYNLRGSGTWEAMARELLGGSGVAMYAQLSAAAHGSMSELMRSGLHLAASGASTRETTAPAGYALGSLTAVGGGLTALTLALVRYAAYIGGPSREAVAWGAHVRQKLAEMQNRVPPRCGGGGARKARTLTGWTQWAALDRTSPLGQTHAKFYDATGAMRQ